MRLGFAVHKSQILRAMTGLLCPGFRRFHPDSCLERSRQDALLLWNPLSEPVRWRVLPGPPKYLLSDCMRQSGIEMLPSSGESTIRKPGSARAPWSNVTRQASRLPAGWGGIEPNQLHPLAGLSGSLRMMRRYSSARIRRWGLNKTLTQSPRRQRR
jgi:hypothetical protein